MTKDRRKLVTFENQAVKKPFVIEMVEDKFMNMCVRKFKIKSLYKGEK